ncbi:hypothetical protein SL053_002158 [Flavobacterium psychrophilum]|nr:hypothetical protein [Flavobacterium psychrophilum]
MNDTFNKVSLNQAGIKSTFILNLKGAEKLVIDVTKEYKNYWDVSTKVLKDWTFITTESDVTKRPAIWKSEDGESIYEFKDGKVANDTRMLLDELEDTYYTKYGKTFKGAIIFVVDEDYFKPNTLGYSQTCPLRSQGTIIFKGGIIKTDTYTHEVGHMLGLEHTFFNDTKDFNEANNAIKNNVNNISIHKNNVNIINGNFNPSIDSKDLQIKNHEESIINYQKQIKESKLKSVKEERVKWIDEEKIELEKTKTKRQEKINERNKEIEDEQKKINDETEKMKINVSNKFRTKNAKTFNFLDYDIIRLYFSKDQVKTMKNETTKYY